ncbi:MAG: CxxxxCH/CxxCH domain-containing protein [Myxococcales bacterium]|nr:CxxxxCH/CxxCH domain-containing protein [Myxococcales bacterium]
MLVKRSSPCEMPPQTHPRNTPWYWGGLWLLTIAFGMVSCTVLRDFPTSPMSQNDILYEPAVTYQSLKQTIDARCVSCHGAQRKEGDYEMSSYTGIRGVGRDHIPNAIAGDSKSLILSILREDATEPAHRPTTEDAQEGGFIVLLRRWVVDYRMAYFRSSIHSSDIHLPGTTGFHGALIQKEKWNWAACTRCHGEDLGGGSSGVSCIQCHDTRTDDGCASCHSTKATTTFRSPSTVGSRSAVLHQRHVRDALANGALCQTCHPVPTGLIDGVHLDGKVQVQLSRAAAYQGKQPVWDTAAKTCSDTYCHGAGLEGAKVPTWEPPQDTNTPCQSCHGMPPKQLRSGAMHPVDTRCSTCHPSAHQDNKTIKEPALHLNGQVEVSFQGDCKTCHGDAESSAPPRDLSGNTETSAMGVGAHGVHLAQDGNKRHLVIPCASCHQVPGDVFSKGHIDTAGPAEVTFQGLALSGSLSPQWDRTKGTCGQVYCHGATLDGGKQTTPIWNQVGTGQGSCGSCHGMPPRKLRNGDSHTASTACSSCHTNVRPDLSFVDPSLHINGRVEL